MGVLGDVALKSDLLMKPLLVLLLGGALLGGCRKRKAEVATPAPPPPIGETQPAAPVQSPTRTVPGPGAPTGPHPGEPLNAKEVRAAYHRYFEKIGSFPNSWQEMIRHKLLLAAPQGKNGQPLDFTQFTLWEASYPAR